MPTYDYKTFTNIYPSDTNAQLTVANTLLRDIVPYVVVQNVKRFAPLARWILSKTDVKPMSAPFIAQPVKPAKASTNIGTLTYDGTLSAPAIEDETIYHAIDYPVVVYVGISFSDPQVKLWTSPFVIVDQLSLQVSEKYRLFIDYICNKVTGSRSGTNDFNGIDDIVSDSGTFMNLDRTTYTWWAAPVLNVQSVFGAYGTTIDSAWKYITLARRYYEKNFQEPAPNLMFTSLGVFERIRFDLTQFERFIIQDTAKITDIRHYEVSGIVIDGIFIFPDRNIEEGTAYMLRDEHIYFTLVEGYDLAIIPFFSRLPADKFQWTSYMLFGGQLWSDRPCAFMKLTNLPYVSL